ncbi:glycoside hydrolase family 130 protein [Mucilaginibacter paludis]|uniref:Glycosidase related protein n=1 Tax=Mucilaginibacter paludis DSM 18603 TaxID=714943 RepID=H1Y812_9SPHI|nr:glycosidase [Mucilaginibacter paludis]EHQ31034.1 glycosidase related protein [Mucilaginibacter paludis DSM 18603]
MNPFKLNRLGTIMRSQPGNPLEEEGVCNPAVVRGPDGHLYLFPRLVAKGNYSRIGIARVLFNEAGDPFGVERLGIALEPQESYEKRPGGGGGCEDARITYVEPLQYFQMTYTAYGPDGPRIAIAQSKDLLNWERLGLVSFSPYKHINFNGVFDKDASLFPIDMLSPHGHPSVAMLHRPLFPGTSPEEIVKLDKKHKIDLDLESIWISYCNLKHETDAAYRHAQFTSHHRLASPEQAWEQLKIGAGAPPVLTRHGWLLVYHGVHELEGSTKYSPKLCYSAGVMILSENEPMRICYRSKAPVLIPELEDERIGTIANVVFPTGIDCRTDLGQSDRYDVYYGMADDCIGVATMKIPDLLP